MGQNSILGKSAAIYRENGASGVVVAVLKKLIYKANEAAGYNYHRIFRSGRTFVLNGRKYPYFYHKYCRTWMNERIVEVPVVMEELRRLEGGNILEVGNVLSHYFQITHEVIDKYEKSDKSKNIDVVDFRPDKKYDLIVSISTLEHVGWDETPREPEKLIKAVKHLSGLLKKKGGRLIVTLPLGYNTEMDRFIKTGKLRFTETYLLKRVSADNRWAEAGLEEIGSIKYDEPYISGNGLVIGIIKNP